MKLKELTPKEYMCGNCGCGCPAVFKTEHGTYVIIGKKTTDIANKKLAPDEVAIKIDKAMLKNLT